MRIYSGLYTILFLILCSTSKLMAQEMTPEQVVQKQLEAYNQRNIEAFMAVIDPDITFYSFTEGTKTMSGAQACKKFYSTLFKASPNLNSTIISRTLLGNKVIDHESITGRNGNEEVLELVLIYEVKNEKIIKVTVLQKEG